MSIEVHFLSSWIVGAVTTNNKRDCGLITLAGVLPDLDGLGILLDALSPILGGRAIYYERYHHFLLHGLFGGLCIAALLACFAQNKWRVALIALAVFHFHLFCDLVGSRGPDAVDLWPIFYLGPFSHDPMWVWKGQLNLDSWPNHLFAVSLLAGSIWLAVRQQRSFVALFNSRWDKVIVAVLTKWHACLRQSFARHF